LPFLFDGEEFSRFARFWTHGYDVYTPNKIVIGHDYVNVMGKNMPAITKFTTKEATGKAYEPDATQWITQGMTQQYRRQLYDDSIHRMNILLSGDPTLLRVATDGNHLLTNLASLTKYGLGNKRTLDQFIEFTGIDVRSKTVFGDRCKQLSWVSFHADQNPEVDEGDVWGDAPEVKKTGAGDIPIFRDDATIVFAPLLNIGDGSSLHHLTSGNENNLRSDGVVDEMGDVWYPLIVFDWMIDSYIRTIDTSIGQGMGEKVLKLMLLGAPIFVIVVAAAIWVVTGGTSQVPPINTYKRI